MRVVHVMMLVDHRSAQACIPKKNGVETGRPFALVAASDYRLVVGKRSSKDSQVELAVQIRVAKVALVDSFLSEED